jgi:hypothetical protein
VANFPALKTGVVAQYPADRTRRYSTQVYRFVDGSEQRFPEYGPSLKKWSIRLALLDERELTELGDFFVSMSGRSGQFSFTDPWDGTVYPNCSLDRDEFDAELRGVGQASTNVIVRENR